MMVLLLLTPAMVLNGYFILFYFIYLSILEQRLSNVGIQSNHFKELTMYGDIIPELLNKSTRYTPDTRMNLLPDVNPDTVNENF